MTIRLLLSGFAFLLVLPLSAQKEDQTGSARILGGSIQNPYRHKKKPLGSPYSIPAFAKASVPLVKLSAYMRYNIYKDEFEFITPKNDTLILDKNEDFGFINFDGLNKNYVLTPYTVGKKLEYGYLLNVYEKNGWVLFKKENVGFTEEKIAKTTLESNMPAKYSKMSDRYFLRAKDGTVNEFPDGKKALTKAFPAQKDKIEAFLKEHKIDFDQFTDLKQIVDLLGQ